MADDTEETDAEFHDAVNMTARQFASWLGTEGAESIGHAKGRRIVEILDKPKGDSSDDDPARVRRVGGDVHRYLAQRPDGDIEQTRWCYALMNRGHDLL